MSWSVVTIHDLSGPIRANRFPRRKNKKPFFCESTFQKMDSSEDWTQITRIWMRTGEKMRFSRSGPSASIFFCESIAREESAKRWCANRLPTKWATTNLRQVLSHPLLPSPCDLHCDSDMQIVQFSMEQKPHRPKTPPAFRARQRSSGKSKRGLSKGGLSPKGANRAKKGPFGAISALPPSLWGAEELVPIGPEKAPTSPEMAPICPEKARFSRKDFPPIFSENLGLKPPFVSPLWIFPRSGEGVVRRNGCPKGCFWRVRFFSAP